MMSLFRFFLLEFEFGLTDVSRKCEKVLVAVVVEGFLIDWCCFLKGFFTVRNLRQSFINRLWNVANNAWRVVRLFVDVEGNVLRYVEWHVRSIRQIEVHIKEVYEANKQIENFVKSTTFLRHYTLISNAGARLKKFIIHKLQLFPKSKQSIVAELKQTH